MIVISFFVGVAVGLIVGYALPFVGLIRDYLKHGAGG